jgi:hypothetical protein
MPGTVGGDKCQMVDCQPVKCSKDKPYVYRAKGDCCRECHATKEPTGPGAGGTSGNTGATNELACPHEKGSLGEKDVCYKFEEKPAEQGNFDCKKHCEKGLTCAPKMDAGVGIGFNSYWYCSPLGGGPTGGLPGESDALGDIGDKCTSQAGVGSCQKGLFCKKTKAGATCADRCERMRCANCKRGVCGSQCPCGERCDLGTGPDGRPSMGADGKATFKPSLIKNAGICMENGECSRV